MREVLGGQDLDLVRRAHFLGVEKLRRAIADYLYRARGIRVSPECMVIGAGIEYLYGRLVRILPPDSVYGVENPGYRKIPRIYEEYGLPWKPVDMDEKGISMESLRESGADVIHVSPEHHLPSVTCGQEPQGHLYEHLQQDPGPLDPRKLHDPAGEIDEALCGFREFLFQYLLQL